jgi:hypothetical protein
MALQTSGAISLNDLHVEAGGGSGSTATVNDSDIRGMIGKSSGAQASFSEYYGASSALYSATVSIPANANNYYYGCRHPQYGGGFADWNVWLGGASSPSSTQFDYIGVAADTWGTEFFILEYKPGQPTLTGATQLSFEHRSNGTVYSTASLSSVSNLMDNDTRYSVVSVQGQPGTFSQFFGTTIKVVVT